MKGTVVFLNRYSGRIILFFILTLVLLRLTGADTTLAQSCGRWNVVASPNVGNAQNYLNSVFAITPNDVWVVGTASGTASSGTLTEHWNGMQWSVVPSPSVGIYPSLNSVSGVATNDVWAVGNYGVIEHWNGQHWQLVSSSNNGTVLLGVTAISANDVWAVGSTGGTTQTFIEHWNGTQWSVVPHPDMTSRLYAITAVASNEVWTVGDALYAQRDQNLIEHWDGNTWKMMYDVSPGCQPSLYGVTALSPTDVWAVGSAGVWGNCIDGSSNPLIEHWDGTQWSIVSSPNVGSMNNSLNGVSGLTATTQVWAAGSYTGKTGNNTLIESYC